MRNGPWLVALLIAASGCGEKKKDDGGGGGGKAKAKVALELTGDVTVSLVGEDGECSAGSAGIKEARGFSIHGDQLGAPANFHLKLTGMTDAPDGGAAFVRLDKAEFLRDPGSSVTVTDANLFTVDSKLKEKDGTRTIVVKGTVQCP